MIEDRVATAIRAYVDAGELAGAAALVWRDGKAHITTVGWRNVDTRLPIERDTIFRIASMTKPVTSTAALMLFEEGRFALDDPITRWAPEFSQMRVLWSPDASLVETNPAERPITFEDLLTHRSGLTYGDFHRGPIASAYKEALGGAIDSDVAPDRWIERLAALPLIDQPGRSFHYGHSTDLLGLLIARMEDAPLEDVLKRRIFDPLGMTDTGFTSPGRSTVDAPACTALTRQAVWPRFELFLAGTPCPNAPTTWPMSRAARAFGRRSTTISLSRGCSWSKARWTACGCCGRTL